MSVVKGQAVRRREGQAPNTMVMAESGTTDGVGPVDMLRQHYKYSGSVGVPELNSMLRSVDAVHGRGAGKAAHRQLLESGEVQKGRTVKRVSYHPSSEYGD